jgi:hypothetical protein
METEKLKQAYRSQLIQVGVNSHKAAQASRVMTEHELQLISEIWPKWVTALLQAEDVILSSIDSSQLLESRTGVNNL